MTGAGAPIVGSVNPARAGMIRGDGLPARDQRGKPRASGDDPVGYPDEFDEDT